MLDVVADSRIEVFTEGKDLDGMRFFLHVTPRENVTDEKFSFAGSVESAVESQRAKGISHRDAVLAVLEKALEPMSTLDVVHRLGKDGMNLAERTVQRHLDSLFRAERCRRTGKGKTTRYFALGVAGQRPSGGNGGGGIE